MVKTGMLILTAKGRQMKKQKHHNGFSLVEVLVTVGVVSIMGLAMASMISSLERQNKALGQKLESIELEQSVNRILVDNTSCGCLFDYPAWTTGTPEISLNHLKKGCNAENLLTKDASIFPNSQLKVETIKLKNITPLVGSGTISGDVEIVLKNGISSMKPIRISGLRFSPDDITTPTKIAGCVGVAGAQTMCTGMGGSWDGSKCIMSTNIDSQTSKICTNLGGSWDGSSCSLVAKSKTCPSQKVSCGMWNLSKCTLPEGVQGQIYKFQAGACGSSTAEASAQCLEGTWNSTYPTTECGG